LAKTIREIRAEKEVVERKKITITNISKQLISIHLNPPKNVDFYIGAEDKRLRPGQTYQFNASRVRLDQVERLQKMGKISVVK
jgi:hypothetical protein